MLNCVVAQEYQVVKKLGAGAFGEVFKAINNRTQQQVAIKVQKGSLTRPQLFYQAKVLVYLQGEERYDTGLPHCYSSCCEGQYNLMIMDLFGPTLEQLFGICNRNMDLKSVCIVGIQMIERIQFIHSKNIIHRDIKPDNFVMGLDGKCYKVYLIDFGLAKKYIQKDGTHIPYKDTKQLTGTARYASVNTHLGIQQSRRDDLEVIAHVLIYFLKGSLPWQNIKSKNKKQKYDKIMEQKLSIPLNQLCSDVPSAFMDFLKYSRNLQFEDKPDYNYLKGLLNDLMHKNGFQIDYQYCWGGLRLDEYNFSEHL